MGGFKFKPVAWLTTVSAVLSAVAAVPTLLGILPPDVALWLVAANTVVTVILGALAHNRVTPLACPRDANGRALISVTRP